MKEKKKRGFCEYRTHELVEKEKNEWAERNIIRKTRLLTDFLNSSTKYYFLGSSYKTEYNRDWYSKIFRLIPKKIGFIKWNKKEPVFLIHWYRYSDNYERIETIHVYQPKYLDIGRKLAEKIVDLNLSINDGCYGTKTCIERHF